MSSSSAVRESGSAFHGNQKGTLLDLFGPSDRYPRIIEEHEFSELKQPVKGDAPVVYDDARHGEVAFLAEIPHEKVRWHYAAMRAKEWSDKNRPQRFTRVIVLKRSVPDGILVGVTEEHVPIVLAAWDAENFKIGDVVAKQN